MAQVQVRINGRAYEVACDDGQEEHVARLGRYVDKKVVELSSRIGQIGDTRLLVMTALLITDELSEAFGELENIRAGRAGIARPDDKETAERIAALARRIEDIADSLERA